MGFPSFMLGLAAGFLASASISLALGGILELYYLVAGGACASASVAVALFDSRRAGRAARAASTRPSRL
ncbi:MAG TPA: hypothetical protein VJ874_02790 [Candidatus Thermoplasmatota archaeon]|nr:hypothetical protein [Candidatus Thermoplasmatota archaeon]